MPLIWVRCCQSHCHCLLNSKSLFNSTLIRYYRSYTSLFLSQHFRLHGCTAVSEHGLRIMAMLYLTPVLPLGPVSYMCGSTSMALSSFVFAKIASLPLMLLYVYIGAAAGTLIADADAIEHNSTLILSGIGLSAIMITCISHYIRKELMHILDRQKSGGKKVDEPNDVELGPVQSPVSHNEALQRRHVANDVTETDAPQKAK